MKAYLRAVRISPKKVNLVADLVRGKPVEWALNFLQFTPKRSAKSLMETLRSAVANAEQNFKQDRKELFVSQIIVNQGSPLKRFRPVSRGRSHPILKKTTHITIEVGVRAAKGAQPEAKKVVHVEAPQATAEQTTKKTRAPRAKKETTPTE